MDPSVSFTLNNIHVRALEPEDADLLYEWENDPDVWRVSNVHLPFSKDTLKQFVKNFQYDIYQSKQVRWMIDLVSENHSTPIGTIDLFDFDAQNRRVGIGILIKEDEHRRKGYASDALEIVIDYCFNILHLNQVHCSVPVYNKASLQLFKKQKFIQTGERKKWLFENGVWIDEIFMQRFKDS